MATPAHPAALPTYKLANYGRDIFDSYARPLIL
jgi:hypothetical protein